MHRRISRALIHFSWYALVSAIVIGILIISLIWLTSSSIDDLRPKILEWVHTTTGQPIEVENLEVEWRGIIPHLKLSDIEVLDRNSHKSLTHFDQASLSVDLYHSFINWKATIGHLELSGLDIELVHQKDGTISLLGLTEQASNSEEFTRWLLQQPDLIINDSHITWHEESLQVEPTKLSDVELKLTNNPLTNKHQLTGSAQLPNHTGEFEFNHMITGDPLTSNWDAVLDLSTKELDFRSYLPANVTEKLKNFLPANTAFLKNTRLNSNVKIDWQQAHLSDLNGQFSLKSVTTTDSISGDFIAEKTAANNWLLTAPNLSISNQEHQWQPFSIEFLIPADFSPDEPSIDVAINNLKVVDLLTFMPESIKSHIDKFQPQGELDNLRIQFDKKNNQQPLLIDGEFSNFETLPYEKIPGFKNLSGKFHSNMDVFLIDFNSHNLIVNNLSDTGELEPPIKLDNLIGELNWRKLDQGWVLSTPQLTISNPDLEFQLTGVLKNDNINSPYLEAQGTFFRGNVEPVVKMIPSNILQSDVNEWLDRAIVSGRLTGGNVFFRGTLDKFPFDQNNEGQQEGVFEVRLNAEDGILDYFEGWPRIENINAEVLFTGRKMIITSPSAKIYDAVVKNTTVEISDLLAEKHHLLIKGNAVGNMKDGLQYLNNSPLKTSVGKKLNHLKLAGILDLDLDLDIPLYEAGTPKVEGQIHLDKNSLSIKSLDLELKTLKGDFIFDRNRWLGKDLKARLFESAISIYLDIDDSKENAKSNVRLTGLADKNYITNRMIQTGLSRDQLKILESISGTTTWQAELSLPAGIGDPDEETGLVISSSLKGLDIHAPAPIGKLSTDIKPLKISTTLSNKPDRKIDFEHSDIVKGNLRLETHESKTNLSKISLRFGKGKLTENKKSKYLIQADGNITDLDLSAWSTFLDKHSDHTQSLSKPPSENSLKFDLTIDHLTAAAQSFENTLVLGKSGARSWDIEIDSETTSGKISIPYEIANQSAGQSAGGSVRADFRKLKLVSAGNEKENSNLNPEDIPEMIISSESFQFNELQFGSLQLHIKPEDKGTRIEKLVLSSTAATIEVGGKWTGKNKGQRSEFKILANGQALGPMLEQFGFSDSGVENGQTNISIDTSWQGSPADFDLAKVKGNLKLDVGSGRFTEIKNRVGKIFGLLSIQSLGRRLSLDFNDLFKKGFTFDQISGDFDIDRGNAYTNNLNMTGTSANINITGRIGLSDQDYDQLITVTPSVSDSLPVASALFGPIGAGVGAAIFLAEKVIPLIPDTINKVLEKQYTLTGKWDEPVVEPLKIVKKNQNTSGFPVN